MSDLGAVVPFLLKAARGDWSPAERARLVDFAGRLTARDVEAACVYGVADDGDPWCAITDHRGEVLVHVARIDGRYLIHDAASDAVQHADSLWRAFESLLPRSVASLPAARRQDAPALARAAILGPASSST